MVSLFIGVSSNDRTAVSGAVCEGSTPSTPAIGCRKASKGLCGLLYGPVV